MSKENDLSGIVNVLGGHPQLGVAAILLTCVAFVTLEGLRLISNSRWSSYSQIIKRIALTAAILSMLLMMSRFARVEGL